MERQEHRPGCSWAEWNRSGASWQNRLGNLTKIQWTAHYQNMSEHVRTWIEFWIPLPNFGNFPDVPCTRTTLRMPPTIVRMSASVDCQESGTYSSSLQKKTLSVRPSNQQWETKLLKSQGLMSSAYLPRNALAKNIPNWPTQAHKACQADTRHVRVLGRSTKFLSNVCRFLHPSVQETHNEVHVNPQSTLKGTTPIATLPWHSLWHIDTNAECRLIQTGWLGHKPHWGQDKSEIHWAPLEAHCAHGVLNSSPKVNYVAPAHPTKQTSSIHRQNSLL